jgi:hypothetical protein
MNVFNYLMLFKNLQYSFYEDLITKIMMKLIFSLLFLYCCCYLGYENLLLPQDSRYACMIFRFYQVYMGQTQLVYKVGWG